MIDHVTIGVSDLARSVAFYDPVLSCIGVLRLYAEAESFVGYGEGTKAFFWIGRRSGPITGMHIAFTAADRSAVDQFHAAAVAVGGRDNGAPGLRPHHHDSYYGAFVLDPDGHNIEAVYHL